MEHMVFGDPITEETLRGMDEYKNKTTITRTDIANVALSTKDAAEAQASEHLEKLKGDRSATDGGVITYGKIHNATGANIIYSVHHDFSGKPPSGYPKPIKNGQFGMFTHKETSGSKKGSCGAVVYWGTNDNEEACDFMFSWSNPTNKDNRVLTEIAEHGRYNENSIWGPVHKELIKSVAPSQYQWGGFVTYMTTTPSNTAETGVDVDATVTIATAKAKAKA